MNSKTASKPGATEITASDSDLLTRLAAVPTANAKQILRELGVARTVIAGAMRLSTDRRIAGRARTLRYLPAREDAKPPAAGVNRKLIETLEPGDVVVTETGGLLEGAVLGDMLAARAFARGAAGLVTDGVVRDIEGIREVGLPVWARGTFPDSNVSYSIPWDSDIAIRCGGTLVLPGDFILADTDAAMVVPPSHVEAMLVRAETLAIEDIFSQNLLRAGVPLDDAYPIPASRREEYERFAAEHKGKKA